MTADDVRELRQNASDLGHRAESGETVTVTVSGRAVAQLGPLQQSRWRTWDDTAEMFRAPIDETWVNDRELLDTRLLDPFAE